MAKKVKSDLRNCPFCGIMLSWHMSNDITFNNIHYFKCKNCGGEISINKNSSLDPNNLFAPKNVFTVESVGGYNFSKSAPRENLTVIEMQQRARKATDEIQRMKDKKEAVLKGLINEDGEIINTPKGILKKKKKQRAWIGFILLVASMAMLWTIIK